MQSQAGATTVYLSLHFSVYLICHLSVFIYLAIYLLLVLFLSRTLTNTEAMLWNGGGMWGFNTECPSAGGTPDSGNTDLKGLKLRLSQMFPVAGATGIALNR